MKLLLDDFDESIAQHLAQLDEYFEFSPANQLWTREKLLAKAEEFAGETMNCGDFCTRTGIRRSRVYALFSGWKELAELAGIVAPHGGRTPVPDDAIYADIVRVWRLNGSFPTGAEYSRKGIMTVSNVHTRLGRWSTIRETLTRRYPAGPPRESQTPADLTPSE